MRALFSAFILLSLAGIGPVEAQTGLTGRITWQGKPVSGARVRLPDLQRETVSDSQGRYAFAGTGLALTAGAGPGPMPSGEAFLPDGRAQGADPSAQVPRFRPRAPGSAGSAGSAPPLAKRSPATRLEVAARGYRDTLATFAEDAAVADLALEKDLRRHLWIWGSTPATSAAERDSLFAFSLRKGIGTLYLDCAGLLRNDRPALVRFIRDAKAKGLAVELLFGAPQWALPANHGTPVELARLTLTLLADLRAAGVAYPTSIQMDVEPYSLPAWDTDRAGVAGGLVDMYLKLRDVLKGTPVGVTACIPRWFETIPLARGGAARPLSEWLADASERLTLMDYVDHANGVIQGAAQEIAYADAAGGEVVIGVETIPDLEPESVTFAEEGEAAMEDALAKAAAAYGSRPSYFGIAIHHWDSYPALKP